MALKKVELSYMEYRDLDELDSEMKHLVQQAKEASKTAYAPYSLFKVGASVLLSNGDIVKGSNQENIAYPSGLCAERVVINSASSLFPNEKIVAIAVSSDHHFENDEDMFSPCGACRQVMAEAELRTGKKLKIIVNTPGGITRAFNGISQLLPFTFNYSGLKKAK